jgi:hypothetical protein
MSKLTAKISFIITKPLQFMVMLSIVEEEFKEENIDIYFCNEFSKASLIQENFQKYCEVRFKSYLCNSRLDALKEISNKSTELLFLDSDVGFQNSLAILIYKIKNIKCKVNVIEEGNGTYEMNRYKGLKRKIFQICGVGTDFGSCFLTSKIYVHSRKEYVEKFPRLKLKCKKINTSIWSLIQNKNQFLKEVFGQNQIKNTHNRARFCHIYMTGYVIERKIINNFLKLIGPKYIKLHPHIKKNIEIESAEVLDNHVPIELILNQLLLAYDEIIVYGHESSCKRYVKDKRIKFINQ